MAKTLSAFQRWRLNRKVQKQFQQQKKEILAMYEDEHSKFRAYYDKSLKSRIARERGYAEMSEKGAYDVRTYDQFATRRTAEEHLPFTRYFGSVKENVDKMLAAAETMAIAEAAQAQGYIPWEKDANAYAAAKTQYEESRAALAGLEKPNRKIGTVWLIDPFIDAMGTLQTHLGTHEIGQRTEVDLEAASVFKTKAEKKWEEKQAKKRNREINKQLRQNARKSKEREARQQEQIKAMPEEVRAKYGLNEPERKSVGDQIKDKLHAAKVDRQIDKQLKDRDKTRAEREARQQEAIAKMDEKQRAKYGLGVREKSDDLTRE